jgi:hypothetical protein
MSLAAGSENVVLSLADLRALDNYLERYGEGLAYVPLFQKPDQEQELWHFSRWDVLAMAEIQRGINTSEVSTRMDIQDVPLPEGSTDVAQSTDNAEWLELLDDQGPSLVCLGSSRTGPAAEAMLCKMFKRPRFEDALPAQKKSLPFHFVWSEKLPYVFSSHFRLRANDVFADNPDAAELIQQGKASAVAIGDRVLVDRMTQRRWGDTYGVCVAQRRKRGQVWLVLAGVTGAATYVAAKLAKHLATRLDEAKRGQNSDVYWAVIKASIESGYRLPYGRIREFSKEEIFEGPHVWQPNST